jgi:hypothetical protein
MFFFFLPTSYFGVLFENTVSSVFWFWLDNPPLIWKIPEAIFNVLAYSSKNVYISLMCCTGIQLLLGMIISPQFYQQNCFVVSPGISSDPIVFLIINILNNTRVFFASSMRIWRFPLFSSIAIDLVRLHLTLDRCK